MEAGACGGGGGAGAGVHFEELDDGRRFTVFLPSIPTPLARAVYILSAEWVHLPNVPFTQVIKTKSRWGSGSKDLVAALEGAGKLAGANKGGRKGRWAAEQGFKGFRHIYGQESTFRPLEHSQANQLAIPLIRSAALLFGRRRTRDTRGTAGGDPEAAKDLAEFYQT